MKKVKVKQRDITDCGAACLASVAAYYELEFPVARIRQFSSTDKKGTNVLGMVEAAKKLGFESKGVKGNFDSLFKIPVPAIAHIVVKDVLHHFVVIYDVTLRHIEVMDPADGQMHHYTHDDFKKVWTNILIVLLPGKTFERGKVAQTKQARLLKLVGQYKGILTQALFGALVYTLIGLSTSVYVQKIVDYVLVDGNRNLLNLMSTLMIGLLAVSIFIGYMKSLFTLQTGQEIDSRLILGYYQHLLSLPMRFFDSMRSGEILSRINDAVKIRAFINDAFINIAVNLFVILFSFALMFTYYWKLAIVILLVIPFYIILYLITNFINKKVERKLMEDSAELESHLVESLNSIRTIKSFALESLSQLKTEIKFHKLLQSVYTSGINSLGSTFSTEFISRLFTILLLWIGGGFVLENQITPGELLSFYTLIGYFTGPASSLIGMNKTIQNAWIAADRLFEITDLEREENGNKIILSPEMIGNLHFNSVNFRYGTNAAVFRDFTLSIEKGTSVAIVGESGSGKSTLIQLLQNLYPLTSGSIHLAGYDLKYVQNNSLRTLIAAVPQKIDLFAGNIVENISIGDDTPDMTRIISVCTSLGMMEFIEKLPGGFNTYIGENGTTLSGGQRQKIAIARALYRDPEILILDEATSSLDSTSEKLVQDTLNALKARQKTIIMIAHRLALFFRPTRLLCLRMAKLLKKELTMTSSKTVDRTISFGRINSQSKRGCHKVLFFLKIKNQCREELKTQGAIQTKSKPLYYLSLLFDETANHHSLPTQKIYFASDFHLGVPNADTSLERERKVIAWLEMVKPDAHSIYLLGDIFDFWFEYKHTIPKGFIRFQGKLAELRDAGVPVYFFTGIMICGCSTTSRKNWEYPFIASLFY